MTEFTAMEIVNNYLIIGLTFLTCGIPILLIIDEAKSVFVRKFYLK